MTAHDIDHGVAGRVLRFTWTDGPTKGTAHDHSFHSDGTVEWHEAGKGQAGDAGADRPRFSDERIASNVRLVSYLSKSGFTLTVALNGDTGHIAGIASSDKVWVPVHGTFEVTG